jgi:hypothetical protein
MIAWHRLRALAACACAVDAASVASPLPSALSPLLSLPELPSWPYTSALPGAISWNEEPPLSTAHPESSTMYFDVDNCDGGSASSSSFSSSSLPSSPSRVAVGLTPTASTYASIDNALAAVAAARAQPATQGVPMVVRVPSGVCPLKGPVVINASHSGAGPNSRTVIAGAGPDTVLSGGAEISTWRPVSWPGAPPGRVFAASTATWPVEIKTLRLGAAMLPRARWPNRVGDGTSTPNWLFAAGWSAPGGMCWGEAKLNCAPSSLL